MKNIPHPGHRASSRASRFLHAASPIESSGHRGTPRAIVKNALLMSAALWCSTAIAGITSGQKVSLVDWEVTNTTKGGKFVDVVYARPGDKLDISLTVHGPDGRSDSAPGTQVEFYLTDQLGYAVHNLSWYYTGNNGIARASGVTVPYYPAGSHLYLVAEVGRPGTFNSQLWRGLPGVLVVIGDPPENPVGAHRFFATPPALSVSVSGTKGLADFTGTKFRNMTEAAKVRWTIRSAGGAKLTEYIGQNPPVSAANLRGATGWCDVYAIDGVGEVSPIIRFN
jgi:hypothetical protein